MLLCLCPCDSLSQLSTQACRSEQVLKVSAVDSLSERCSTQAAVVATIIATGSVALILPLKAHVWSPSLPLMLNLL